MARQQSLKERTTELQYVEAPLLKQLKDLGWELVQLEMHNQKPSESWREGFDEVVLLPKLRESLLKLNDWMEDDQIEEAVRDITERVSGGNLLERNKEILDLLLRGTKSDVNHRTGIPSPTVSYIDFENPLNNSFIAVSQFKVRIPNTDRHIIPDVTLFINGIPVVVIECKSPQLKEPMFDAIDQLMRYSEQRGYSGEGNPKLFFYNQITVATYGREAKFGTITTDSEQLFRNWLDPYPLTLNELEHGASTPNNQQRLVAGMFSKENLVSLIRTFTIFSTTDEGKVIKIVARYQQFRAVKKGVERLLNGRNKSERGGIIWHTQGSGKSLTMMFMVREMYTHNELLKWKVVYLTDRTQLQGQLSETIEKAGFNLKVADSISQLKGLLQNDTSDLVMGMIHKFQEREAEATFPRLNASQNILVMTDEAHRSLFKTLGANLQKALPNATLVGYTGTPIDKVEELFGDYIDKYTMREAIDDDVTLEIVYEGRTHEAEVTERETADRKFKNVFKDFTPEQWLEIISGNTHNAYLDSEVTIQAKAEDMVEHYLDHVFPNGFKAQVVANSREAAVRYQKALNTALTKKIQELESKDSTYVNLDVLKRLKTAVVISGGGTNDPEHLKRHADPKQHKKDIENFKLSFDGDSNGNTGDIGFLIVNNMLLTGFDAPIEQVLYLDRMITAHNLLQAIARVNRVAGANKKFGFVVDYVGVGDYLTEALTAYFEREAKEEIENLVESLQNKKDAVHNDLIAAQRKMQDFLNRIGATAYIENYDEDALFDIFLDEDLSFEFITNFRDFSRLLDALYPSPDALNFVKDFKTYSVINCVVEKHVGNWRRGKVSMKGVSEKLRKIADEHLESLGVSQTIEPISILDESFLKKVEKRKSERTQAAEIEHAVRHFVDVNFFEDSELYASFSEKLEEILTKFKNNWALIRQKLEELRQEIIKARNEPTHGLHPRKQMPIFRRLKDVFFNKAELSEEQINILVGLTMTIYDILETELKMIGFWDSPPARTRLKSEIQRILLNKDYWNKLPNLQQNYNATISKILEWAEANNETIIHGK